MKLNKRLCRQYANPGLKLDPDNGLFRVKQVKYIVCTDIQTIENQPILILYFLPREQAAEGDYRPVWTMFQSKNEYITLAVGEDNGKTRWRTASFENLGVDYHFSDSCAFYSSTNEKRVSNYFNSKYTGFAPLIYAQNSILEGCLNERKREKERIILARMDGLPALPDGLEDWAHRNILPAYFIYNHARKGIAKGTCSVCGHDMILENVKHNGKAACPHCGREMTMKPSGRIKHLYDRETGVVIQRVDSNGLIVRIVKFHAKYQGKAPTITVHENARQFVSIDPDGAVKCDKYYLSYGGEMTNWREGTRPVYYNQPTFESITYGHLYCGNLPGALAGTSWQYCPIVPFYNYDKVPMSVFPFLKAHMEHPKFEHLIKMGFYELVCQLVYDPNSYFKMPKIDEGQNRTHRILCVGAEDVAFLRDINVGLEALRLFQSYYQRNLKDRQRLLAWQLEHKISTDLLSILEHTTAHKFMRYMERQYAVLQGRKGEYGGLRYRVMQDVVTEYKDYLDMCEKQNYDLKNSFVLFPKDLQKSHDRVTKRIKIKADMKMREDFAAAYNHIMGQLDFEHNGMKIVYPKSFDEIIAEGNALHHCVGNYVDKVAAKKTMILFLRRSEEVDTPYFTVEVRGQKVVQVRGISNQEPTPEVKRFMTAWERKVLHSRDVEMAAA